MPTSQPRRNLSPALQQQQQHDPRHYWPAIPTTDPLQMISDPICAERQTVLSWHGTSHQVANHFLTQMSSITGTLATETCPAAHLQRLQILGVTTDPPLDILTADPLQVMVYALWETVLPWHTGRHTQQQQQQQLHRICGDTRTDGTHGTVVTIRLKTALNRLGQADSTRLAITSSCNILPYLKVGKITDFGRAQVVYGI